jgi:hypothetical protein
MAGRHEFAGSRMRMPLLLASFFVVLLCQPGPALAADPLCIPTLRVEADSIRSDDNRGFLLNVFNAPVVLTTPAGIVNDINTAIVQNTPNLVTIEAVQLYPTDAPPRIQLTFKKVATFQIYSNYSVTLNLPSSLFVSGTPCGPVTFIIHPSPGKVSANVPVGISEIDINTVDVSFTVTVENDLFTMAYVHTRKPVPSGIHIFATLVGAAPAQAMTIRIAKNDTFNLLSGQSEKVAFVFPRQIMLTQLTPLTADTGGIDTDITLHIAGAQPFINIEYGNTDGVMYSEDVWDGTAVIALSLLGDKWIPDASLWTAAATKPTYTPSRPLQKYGFDYFLAKGLLPIVNVSTRRVWFRFPPMPGFTLSSVPVTSLDVAGFDNLASEHTVIQPVSIRVLKAKPASVQVVWGGAAFDRRKPLTEADLRRSGLSLTVSLKYNIFAEPVNFVALKDIFTRTTARILNTAGLSGKVTNLTTLTLWLPAQPTYDIPRNDIVNVTVTGALTETRVQPFKPSAGFTIQTFSGASKCDLLTPFPLDETRIRDVSGPPLNITLAIVTGSDSFCFSTATVAQLTGSIAFTIDQPDAIIQLPIIRTTATTIVFDVPKNPDFQINQDNFLSLVVPQALMCSLEPCKALQNPGPSYPVSRLQVVIRTTPGLLFATFPNITETEMRSNSYTVEMFLVGDTFAIGSAQEFTFRPQFQITPSDPNRRAFVSSILGGVVAVVKAANKSLAVMTIPRNASYDCAATETIKVIIDPTLTGSQLRPESRANDMVISAVQGSMIASIARNATVHEIDVWNGTFAFTVTLVDELFNTPTAIATDLRATVVSPNVPSERGVLSQLTTYLADAAIQVNAMRSTVTVTLQKTEYFDILTPEAIVLTFGPASVASGVAPINNTYILYVVPDHGRVKVAGSATFAPTLQVVNGDNLVYTLTLVADLWRTDVEFDTKDFCVFEGSTCSPFISDQDRRRQVTVSFARNLGYFLTINRTYPIDLPAKYFLSGEPPTGGPSLFIYVTSGVVSWSFVRAVSTISEEDVRDGALPQITATVSGDKFSVPTDVRSALIAGVSCRNAAGNVSTDPYGFCARAATLFQGLEFAITDNAVMRLQMQGDTLYDIYEAETVTLYLGPTAFQSRLAPNRSYSFTFIVTPSSGRYFLSGTLSGLTQADINIPSRASKVRIDITLHGERWIPNATLAVAALLDGGLDSDSRSSSIRGFLAAAGKILNPDAAGALDSTYRVLTLHFLPLTTFTVFETELVTISVPATAVLSRRLPARDDSAPTGFRLNKPLGVVTVTPTNVFADEVRTTGANVTISITGASWRPLTLGAAKLSTYITTQSGPIEEPKGFAVYRTQLLSTLERNGAQVTSSVFVVPIARTPNYDLSRPEVISLQLLADWVVENVNTDPAMAQIRFDPDYPSVEVVVDVQSNNGAFDVDKWVAVVANALGLGPEDILLDPGTPRVEDKIPAPNRYRRVAFHVRYELSRDPKADPDLPLLYDNTAAKLFVGVDRSFSLRSFNAVTTFLNSTPPGEDFWLHLANPDYVADTGPALGASTIYLLSFTGGILVVFAGVFAWRKANAGKSRPSMRWKSALPGTGNDVLQRKDGLGAEEDEAALRKTAEVLYAGQRAEIPVLRVKDVHEHTAVADRGTTGPSSATFRTAVLHRVAAEEDTEEFGGLLDLPLRLYSGQASAAAAAAEDGSPGRAGYSSTYAPPSFLERMEASRGGGRVHPPVPQPGPGTGGRPMASLSLSSPLSSSSGRAIDDASLDALLGHSALFPDEVDALEARRKRAAEAEQRNRIEYSRDTPYRPLKSKYAVGDHTDYSLL